MVMWPGPFMKTLVFPFPKDTPYEVWLWLAQGFKKEDV